MYGHVSSEGALETQEQRTERRLELEARSVKLGTIDKTDGNTPYDSCRVEVTIGAGGRYTYNESAGYYLVRVPELAGYAELSEAEQLEKHPATIASDLVREELERRYPDAEYLSIDDTYAG